MSGGVDSSVSAWLL
ncbi:hypothetical protein ACUOFC_07345, partial [Escherichia sp. TWPC-MK]